MGDEIRTHDKMEAERRLQHGLTCCGLTEAELPALRKGDDLKKSDSLAHPEKKRANRVDYDPPQNGCHLEFFLLCSGCRAIDGWSFVGAEKQNNELGGPTLFKLR